MCAEIAKAIAALIVGLALAYFGLRLYFRQKEYEIVKQRYLENSLDIIAGELENISSAFSHNWARCLDILKEYRDAPEIFNRSHLTQGFLELSGSKFNRAAHHRLKVLTGSDIFWRTYQLALSRHMALNSVVVNEIPLAIQAQLDGNVAATPQAIVDHSFAELKPMNEQSDHFATLHNALHRLSTELEKERLSFNKVHKFSKRSAVQSLVKELSDFYAMDLESD
jgi:uncharacterized membrane-anchored protein YhcB (DUF1043 family)